METPQAQSAEVGFFTIVKITFLSAPRKASTARENQRHCLKKEFLFIAYFQGSLYLKNNKVCENSQIKIHKLKNGNNIRDEFTSFFH
jgi:hypothetical protein